MSPTLPPGAVELGGFLVMTEIGEDDPHPLLVTITRPLPELTPFAEITIDPDGHFAWAFASRTPLDAAERERFFPALKAYLLATHPQYWPAAATRAAQIAQPKKV